MELKFKTYTFTDKDISDLRNLICNLAETKRGPKCSFYTDGDYPDEQFTDSNGLRWGVSVTGMCYDNGSITIWSLTLVLNNTNGEIWVHISNTDEFEREADTSIGHYDDWTTHAPKDFLI
jgi:hypothetical protein